MRRKKVGIIGCGAIGSAIAEHAQKKISSFVEKIIVCDNEPGKSGFLAEKFPGIIIADRIEEIVNKADIVVEAASPKVVPGLLKMVIENKKDLIVMSIGGLLGNEDLLDKARESGIRVLLPSGAIAGIDAVRSSKLAGIENVTLVTRKSPKSIKGAPYLSEKGIDVDAIDSETVIFEGNASEAMKGFPKNINVSALLSIAGIGARKTKVKIIVSPEYVRNSHEIKVESKAGKLTMRVENVPSPTNPRTSHLAVLAAITSLEGYFDPIRIGT